MSGSTFRVHFDDGSCRDFHAGSANAAREAAKDWCEQHKLNVTIVKIKVVRCAQ